MYGFPERANERYCIALKAVSNLTHRFKIDEDLIYAP